MTELIAPGWPGAALLRMPWQRLVKAVARFQSEQQARRDFQRLDGRARRDIGLYLSEYPSYEECKARAESIYRRNYSSFT